MIIWALLRLVLIAIVGSPADALYPPLPTEVGLLAITVFLVWLDRKRSRETILQANMGVSQLRLSTVSLLTATALELMLQAIPLAF